MTRKAPASKPDLPKVPKRKASAAVKAIADRAEATSAGRPVEEPKVAIDPIVGDAKTPGIGKKAKDELKRIAKEIKAKAEAKARIGYTPELAAEICRRMTSRCPVKNRMLSLSEICEADDMPSDGTVRSWRKQYPEFGTMYARAREERTHIMAEEVVEISDTETDNQRARNRMDARKWFAGKVNRRDYGEMTKHEMSGPDGGPIETKDVSMTESARRLAFMLRAGIEAQRRANAAKTIEAQPAEGQ